MATFPRASSLCCRLLPGVAKTPCVDTAEAPESRDARAVPAYSTQISTDSDDGGATAERGLHLIANAVLAPESDARARKALVLGFDSSVVAPVVPYGGI
jgi:hypothetical protein